MSFLEKALAYRQQYLQTHPGSSVGLLKKALKYLELKDEGVIDSKEDIELNIDLGPDVDTSIKEETHLEKSDIEEVVKVEDKTFEYFEIIDKIANEVSTLPLTEDAHIKLNDIIANNFNLTKSALLIYSPEDQKFIYWSGTNISEDSAKKLSFDLEYNEIYKYMIKEKYYLIQKDDINFLKAENILSSDDVKTSNFQLYIPFVFSGHVIGIYLILDTYDNSVPDEALITSLEIIGRLNGPLLYNIFQQTTLQNPKKKMTK